MSSPARPLRYRGKGHPPPGIHSLKQRQFIQQVIAADGLWIQAVHGDDETSTYGYTIGLDRVGHPELIVTGLGCPHVCDLLETAAHPIVEHGLRLRPGQLLDFNRVIVGVLEVAQPAHWLAVARDLSTRPITALQLALGDEQNRLPRQRDYDRQFVQPLLGNAAWTMPGWKPPPPTSIYEPPGDGGGVTA